MSDIVTLNGYKIKDEKAVRSYETVALMKADTKLKEGQHVKTRGYYSIGDGGNAEYYIVNEVSENDYQEELENGLYATLIIENEVNVKQLGAYGDGEHDDTAKIQKAIDNFNKVYIPSGTYLIDTHYNLSHNAGLYLKSNQELIMDNDTILKAITNNYTHYRIIFIENIDNVKVEGGNLIGDKETHTGTEGEYGAGIYVKNSSNVILDNIKISYTWGDGITITDCTNITTSNLLINEARRNGYTIGAVNGLRSINDKITNTNGTKPEAGVDIEPDYANKQMCNIVFENLVTENSNGSGMSLELMILDNTNNIDISIINHHDYGSHNALTIAKSSTTSGFINILNSFYENSKLAGINLWRCFDSECKVLINNPKIINCNTNLNNTRKYASGITCYIETTGSQGILGNIEIINPFIINSKTDLSSYIYIDNGSNYMHNNIKIINPLNNDNKTLYLGSKGNNFIFEDYYDLFQFNRNISYSISRYEAVKTYNNLNNTGERTITIPNNSLATKQKIKFINLTPENYKLTIKFDSDCYCRNISDNLSPDIKLLRYGEFVEIEKLDENEFVISNVNFNVSR